MDGKSATLSSSDTDTPGNTEHPSHYLFAAILTEARCATYAVRFSSCTTVVAGFSVGLCVVGVGGDGFKGLPGDGGCDSGGADGSGRGGRDGSGWGGGDGEEGVFSSIMLSLLQFQVFGLA
ncbi:hypothetical protein RJT34_09882 [Clitoria ternatea]|uniref:Uncharacterized protein n=1 Tax=Clitoria ternatea TaxID=43366 RepID=A0AAN9K646_CLITE